MSWDKKERRRRIKEVHSNYSLWNKYSCPNCGERFRLVYNLNDHKKRCERIEPIKELFAFKTFK